MREIFVCSLKLGIFLMNFVVLYFSIFSQLTCVRMIVNFLLCKRICSICLRMLPKIDVLLQALTKK